MRGQVRGAPRCLALHLTGGHRRHRVVNADGMQVGYAACQPLVDAPPSLL